jgi:dipeptidyl aminopeptidase/acylaminoacyl peptidase
VEVVMPDRQRVKKSLILLIVLGLVFSSQTVVAQGKKPLTFEDMMKFKALQSPVISSNGLWVAFSAQPDRGDGEVRVHSVKTDKEFVIERGTRPLFSRDSRWVVCTVRPSALDLEKPARDRPKQGMALLNLDSGDVLDFPNVERFAFSKNGTWLAYKLFEEEKKEEKKDDQEENEKKPASKLETGTVLVLRNLAAAEETRIPFVAGYAFDNDSKYLVYAVAEPVGKGNGLFRRTLAFADLPEAPILLLEKGSFKNLAWSEAGTRLAFLGGIQDDKGVVEACSLWLWDGKSPKEVQKVDAASALKDSIIPPRNQLDWTEDGRRLFFGVKPKGPEKPEEPGEEAGEPELGDLFDREKILAEREVDVWHWNDPIINSQQKKVWNRMKDRTLTAVYHTGSGKTIVLADAEMPDVVTADNPDRILGFSNIPYQKEITWDGNFQDVYVVGLADGKRARILKRFSGRPSLSPKGRYLVYYVNKNWHLVDIPSGKKADLTGSLAVSFANEDHDTPAAPRGYGIAGWMEDESAVFIYDKFDIWRFDLPSGRGKNMTGGYGRDNHLIFRILRLDPEKRTFTKGQRILLSSYNDLKKNHGFYSAEVGAVGVERELEELKKFRFLAKAEKADVILYTRESYEEFPDLWTAGFGFKSPRKITDLNPQVKDFAWGRAELVEWMSTDGVPLQGVLIKPGDYEPGKRYPVIIYFYELFSQRLYEFNQIVVNHRPCFPFYASNGYALFLPDVRFAVGHPGPSSVKCVVPGAQKLIDMGVADPDKIGIHGHSWSGYETAYIVTQTDFFACGIAGAAVGNMTSAYSGIRWQSGLARQFQYEKTQSRIGGSLWEKPELFWENSPVFFADRINTPLLLMHGDEDGAVPWYQSIEIYLAMRRLGKDCVFLQYRGEPHHPQKYANKLDYSIKMKEYFDTYLKGKPAPDWISKGVLYNGK